MGSSRQHHHGRHSARCARFGQMVSMIFELLMKIEKNWKWNKKRSDHFEVLELRLDDG